jgi:hypothetical protein
MANTAIILPSRERIDNRESERPLYPDDGLHIIEHQYARKPKPVLSLSDH